MWEASFCYTRIDLNLSESKPDASTCIARTTYKMFPPLEVIVPIANVSISINKPNNVCVPIVAFLYN